MSNFKDQQIDWWTLWKQDQEDAHGLDWKRVSETEWGEEKTREDMWSWAQPEVCVEVCVSAEFESVTGTAEPQLVR